MVEFMIRSIPARIAALGAFVFILLFSGVFSTIACGPYHEWKTLGETIETELGEGAVRDSQFGLAAAMGEAIPSGKPVKICVIEVLADNTTGEVSLKDHGFDETGLATAISRIFAKVKAFSHIEIVPHDLVIKSLDKKGMEADRLFNPAIMEEISREVGVDGYIYATVRDPKVLTRLSSDRQPGAEGVTGHFEVQTMAVRAKLINGSDGMIEWIDEIPGRFERVIIYRPLAGTTAESEAKMAGATSGKGFELLEYIVTLRNSPGSESFVSHDIVKTAGVEGLIKAAGPYIAKAAELLEKVGLVKP